MAYYALLSSLPMLRPDENTYMTSESFLSECDSFLNKREMDVLRKLTLFPDRGSVFPKKSFADRYMQWERSLRNALVKLRAGRSGTDGSPFLDADADFDTTAFQTAQSAFALTDPLEREKLLDRARWTKIEEMEQGNLFSFSQICGYRLKLLICEKWQSRKQIAAASNLDRAVEAVRVSEK